MIGAGGAAATAMKRGDVILVREPNTPARKPRPHVVIQRDSALGDPVKVTACPLTSRLKGAIGQRPFVAPTAENGLRTPSEVEADWIYTHPMDYVGGVIGHIDRPTMDTVILPCDAGLISSAAPRASLTAATTFDEKDPA